MYSHSLVASRNDPFTETYALRSPEAILEAQSGPSADLWSLGCLVRSLIALNCVSNRKILLLFARDAALSPSRIKVYELLTGETLFDPFFQTVELGLTPEESHLIQMIEIMGAFPKDLLDRGTRSRKWFNEEGSSFVDLTISSPDEFNIRSSPHRYDAVSDEL